MSSRARACAARRGRRPAPCPPRARAPLLLEALGCLGRALLGLGEGALRLAHALRGGLALALARGRLLALALAGRRLLALALRGLLALALAPRRRRALLFAPWASPCLRLRLRGPLRSLAPRRRPRRRRTAPAACARARLRPPATSSRASGSIAPACSVSRTRSMVASERSPPLALSSPRAASTRRSTAARSRSVASRSFAPEPLPASTASCAADSWSPAFHSVARRRFCERTAWLAAHAATVGLPSALTAAASSRRPSARSSLASASRSPTNSSRGRP